MAESIRAQDAGSKACIPCALPGALGSFGDGVMDVEFADGTILRNVRSAARTIHTVLDRQEQAIRLTWLDANGNCRDTIVASESVVAFLHEGIGGTFGPLRYPAAPAKEIYRENTVSVDRSFLEIYGMVGYAGADSTSRKIGFNSVYESIEAVVAPFGSLLGDYLSLGAGGGILFEGGRTRFPLFGQLRLTFPASEHVATITKYYPDSCHFEIPGDSAMASPWSVSDSSGGKSVFKERSLGRTDPTVYLTEEKAVISAPFRPYIYIEGGTVFDGNFAGAGTPANAINPEERKPLLLGAGAGIILGKSFMLALGYRYMQLHLATPCPQCVDRTIINRNTVNSITVKAGYRLSW